MRSSGIAEDLDDASFAGQYESVLGVTTVEEVAAAVTRVRASGRASHLAEYRGTHGGGSNACVAVLIQRLVEGSAAGVAFSANPVTGDDEAVVEAVRGLGDRLASGDADADRWVIGAAARPVLDTGVISRSTAEAVGALARRVAQVRGGPQDVEWALDRGEVVVLQARPITGLPLAPALDIPPGRWLKDTIHWSGPMTPVGASILLPLLETLLAEVFAEFGIPLERMRVRSLGGEIYMQEVEIGGTHNSGAPPPWWLGAIAFRCVPPLRRVAMTAKRGLPKLEAYPRAWEESWLAECSSRIDKARAVDLRRLDDEALAGHLDQLVDEVLTPNLRAHFRLVLPDIVALHDLAVCCRDLLGWDDGQVLELLAGRNRHTACAGAGRGLGTRGCRCRQSGPGGGARHECRAASRRVAQPLGAPCPGVRSRRADRVRAGTAGPQAPPAAAADHGPHRAGAQAGSRAGSGGAR